MPIDTKIDGNPETIRGAASWMRNYLQAAVSASTDQVYAARNIAEGELKGEAAQALSTKLTTGGRQAEDFHETISGSVKQADTAAGALQRAQNDMRHICTEAANAGLSVAGDIINEPGAAPAAPGAAPTGRSATPEAVQQHTAAVDAQHKHAAMVTAYKRAQTDAEDVRRRWHQQAQQSIADWQKMKEKSIFTVAGLGSGAATTAASAHKSILQKEAEGLKTRAAQAADHARIIGASDPKGFYQNVDTASANSRAAAAAESRAARVGSTAAKAGNIGGGVLAAGGIAYDIAHGKPADQAIVSGAAGFGASVATGAAAGTVIGGPVGTAVGAVGGVVVGAFTSGAVDSLYENGVGAVGTAISDGAEAVGDTASAVGSLAKDAGEGIAGGVKDAWNALF